MADAGMGVGGGGPIMSCSGSATAPGSAVPPRGGGSVSAARPSRACAWRGVLGARARGGEGRLSEFSQSVALARRRRRRPRLSHRRRRRPRHFWRPSARRITSSSGDRTRRRASPTMRAGRGAGSARLSGTTVAKRNLAGGVRCSSARARSPRGLPSPWSLASVPVLAGDPIAHFEEVQRERDLARPRGATGGGGRRRRRRRRGGSGGAVA